MVVTAAGCGDLRAPLPWYYRAFAVVAAWGLESTTLAQEWVVVLPQSSDTEPWLLGDFEVGHFGLPGLPHPQIHLSKWHWISYNPLPGYSYSFLSQSQTWSAVALWPPPLLKLLLLRVYWYLHKLPICSVDALLLLDRLKRLEGWWMGCVHRRWGYCCCC